MNPTAREDRWTAAGLFAATFAALLATEREVGFVRDESVYFHAAESYARWFKLLFAEPARAFTDAAIVAAFDFNHEHPVLMKTLFGLSHWLFHETLGWVRPATAFRLPAFAAAALIPVGLYLFGQALFGRRAAWFAALSFYLVPRQFFHAHLSAFDVPIAAAWLWVVYFFWRAQEQPRAWLWCGLAFGAALGTKHNALFLPFVLAPFAGWRAWQRSAGAPAARKQVLQLVGLLVATGALYALLYGALGPARFQDKFLLLSPHTGLFVALCVGSGWLLWRLRAEHLPTFRAVAPWLAMVLVGPVGFYLHWPYLWHRPVERTAWYLEFHARHEHYTWFYLGRLLRAPPFPLEYVLVKTALTVPMVSGWCAWAGRAVLSRVAALERFVARPSFAETLVAVNAVASIVIISHPQVPHFGGVKHWFPSMPFLALMGGQAVSRVVGLLMERLRLYKVREAGALATVSLFALLLAPALIATWRVHPYGTSAYSELAGGLPGAATLGMQRQYWSNNVTGVLEWLNANAPTGARVYLHEVNGYSFRDYQRNGMLRSDLRPAYGPVDAQLAVYQYHQEFREHEVNIWQAFETTKPVTGLYVDETPQVVVYRRP